MNVEVKKKYQPLPEMFFPFFADASVTFCPFLFLKNDYIIIIWPLTHLSYWRNSPMHLKKSPFLFLLLLACSLLLYSGCQKEAAAGPMAPEFSLQDLYGKTVSLSSYRGRVVLLDFWATWCPPCRMSIPELVALQEKYRDKGLAVLAVSMDDPQRISNKDLQQFKKMAKINYPVLRYNQKILEDYFARERMAVPTMFIIDGTGKIVEKIPGFLPGALEKSLEPLLK